MKRDWPLVLIAAGLLLGAAAQYFTDGSDVFSGALISLGSVCIGAWLTDTRDDKRAGRDDSYS